ncbi:hypothetical protein F2Q70_00010020 [Brassica cretica]|uniref:PPM-type phosphatase domain-containing protein n=1 Tax=Brassica cretica TaxID=69181 RepID=A0A8S9M9K5_BRACR|nr:hypothetical protein F2Q70_00010020 [Brassica cretica]
MVSLPPTGVSTCLTSWLLWNIWTARSLLVFENRQIPATTVVSKACSSGREWLQAQQYQKQQGNSTDILTRSCKLGQSIRKKARSLSTDNNTSVSLDSAQPSSTQTPVPSINSRSPLSTDNTNVPSTDIFHPPSIDIPSPISIDTEPRDMVAPLILVRDNNGDMHDMEGHLRIAAGPDTCLRILASCDRYSQGDVPRVDGQLAVTRAFGDKSLKMHLSSEPYVTMEVIDDDAEFLILASDGLWKVMSNQEAVDSVKGIKDAKSAAKRLAEEAVARKSSDDISVVVVKFQ